MSNKSYILDYLFGQKWAIYQPALNAMIEIVERVLDDPVAIAKAFHGTQYNKYLSNDNEPVKGALLPSIDLPRLDNTFDVRLNGNVAIIPVTGVIFPRSASVPMSFGAHTTLARLSHDFNVALNSDVVKSIIMVYDTPGGDITGVSEMAQMIFRAREKKLVISYIYGMGASAGFFLSSAGKETVAGDTSEVGSIGVVAQWVDTSEMESKKGIQRHEIISNVSPNKRLDPSTTEGAKQLQKTVDDLAQVFVEAIAKHTGITFQEVLDKFGQGKMFVAKEAMERGMVDRISTLDEVILEQVELHKSNSFFEGSSFMNKAEFMAKHPELFKEVSDDAKLVGMEEGSKIGADAERVRIQSIHAIKAQGYESLVAENMFVSGMTADKVSALIVTAQEEKRVKVGEDTTKDALDAANQSKEVKQDGKETGSKEEEDAAVQNMVKGGNSGRN